MKKLIGITLSGVLLLAGCGSKAVQVLPVSSSEAQKEEIIITTPEPATETTEETDTAEIQEDSRAVYDAVLKQAAEILSYEGEEPDAYIKGYSGLQQIRFFTPLPEALKTAGFAYMDVNADGIEELLLGMTYDYEGSTPTILSMFTVVDGKAEPVIDGSYRSSYSILKDHRIFYTGSNGAASGIAGVYILEPGDSHLTCIDYYFSDPKEDDPYEPQYFHNTEGRYDQEVSEPVEEEDFWNWFNAMLEEEEVLELTSFRQWLMGPVSADFTDVNDNTICFTAQEDVTDFRILEVLPSWRSDKITYETVSEGEAVDLKKGETFVQELTFMGDTPNHAIAYTDADGNEHKLAVGISGYDGSLELIPYED